MSFQLKLFSIFFLSIFLSLLITVPYISGIFNQYIKIVDNVDIENAIEHSFQLFRDNDDNTESKLDNIIDKISIINREYTAAKILKKDALIRGLASLISFLLIQFILIGFLFYFTSRVMTVQLRIIEKGLKKIGEDGMVSFRFPQLKGNEFKHLSNGLNRMLNDLDSKEKLLIEQSKLAGWQEIASFLTHQIKNPLSSIELARVNMDLLIDNSENPIPIKENLDIIRFEITRMNGLINKFRELTEFPSMNIQPYNIERFINRLIKKIPVDQAEFNLSLTENTLVHYDEQFLEQVFLNLFTNSIEAANENEQKENKPVTIYIFTEIKEKEYIIKIHDSITGLPDDFPEKIILPKFTTKENGNGLGLPFVRKVITLHNGHFSVCLTERNGLEFLISLPYRKTDDINN